MQKKLFLIIALLCAVMQGAWATISSKTVYNETQLNNAVTNNTTDRTRYKHKKLH